jgi:hypothetical protein
MESQERKKGIRSDSDFKGCALESLSKAESLKKQGFTYDARKPRTIGGGIRCFPIRTLSPLFQRIAGFLSVFYYEGILFPTF